jgi:hypothetical protein
MTTKRQKSFLHEHSLTIAAASILTALIVLYLRSDPSTHWGSFFGNAIADWTGLLVTVLATKFLFELGSTESRKPPQHWVGTLLQTAEDHSLSIFLAVTGAGWIWLFARSSPNSKWGQVVGNIVSEWTQIFGTVLLTKKLIERHSKESRD